MLQSYSLIEVQSISDESLAKVGDKLIFAEELINQVSEEIGIKTFKIIKIFQK